MNATPEQIEAGQAVYTKRTLTAYDLLVLGVSSKLIWQCPSGKIETLYNNHVSTNHLDVGVGTGYFLDRCRFPSPVPRIALMDVNRDTLNFASKRIARFKPEIYRRNVLEPIAIEAEKFDSIGMSLILHCLPGSIASKSIAFDHLKELMNPGAVVFGATILHRGVSSSWLARRMMHIYNRKGIFSNQQDDLDGLKYELEQRFREVSIEVVGSAALFSGRV